MFGSIEYFTNFFKSSIMNNLIVENPSTMHATYNQLHDEIIKRVDRSEDKERFLRNLDTAFDHMKEILFGLGDENNGS
ncbi:hypothetical protein [Brevibacillus porteri]|uniref:IDEAL domain-containing protein n=1 Tax=Brevibacillus porteri TaxID=2126350 RepID=A0ABX5FVC7_9BACL|nr:hypothetical protein [Brevibacillus porteri]MED1798863.1 hypothetical protein [Brevibacillus porteri]MED2131546.1 hypothetical protein [Brevibacillus porteri]MED2744099.1 hypothetical protein [Brevibacillus porteri]MED2813313.1 hypothetical protein [Brevibacillus porteri]MED2896631.1 hypothetical protein [Brevibacillus porteri]